MIGWVGTWNGRALGQRTESKYIKRFERSNLPRPRLIHFYKRLPIWPRLFPTHNWYTCTGISAFHWSVLSVTPWTGLPCFPQPTTLGPYSYFFLFPFLTHAKGCTTDGTWKGEGPPNIYLNQPNMAVHGPPNATPNSNGLILGAHWAGVNQDEEHQCSFQVAGKQGGGN